MGQSAVFSLTEILSLLGLAQSLYIMVYMVFRSGSWRHAILPMAYFTTLALAFLLDAAALRWHDNIANYDFYQWAFWFSGIPLGTLLIFQIAQTPDLPSPKYALLLFLIPISLAPHFVTDLDLVMYVSGLVCGAISLLAVWLRRDLLEDLASNARLGSERFWLIIAMIMTHTAFLISTFGYVSDWLTYNDWVLVRSLLGIAFVYISATSLFRIYPQAIRLNRKASAENGLSGDEQQLLMRLENLFERDKVYQEPELGRAELARELSVGEATLSRIVNVHYGKTIPQLLSEYRVKDAQKLLKETDVPINNIFAESGFSSMTTFNRVFKELTGSSPSEFRSRNRLI